MLTSKDQNGFWGLLTQPRTYGEKEIVRWPSWAADNDCFAGGGSFDEISWFEWLIDLAPTCRDKCLFAAAPDVFGSPMDTLTRSKPWLPGIRAIGYKAGFVAQTNSEKDSCSLIPWDEFDVLFLGGDTDWKLDARRSGVVVSEALNRGKRVHMGRVNSRKRLRLAASWGCHSADGTYLAFGPDINLPKMLKWRDQL